MPTVSASAASAATKYRRINNVLISGGQGIVCELAEDGLKALDGEMRRRGGRLTLTSSFRSIEEQAKLRLGYESWLAAGRPRKDGPGWEPWMRTAAASRPGRSAHQGGLAIDVDIAGCFQSTRADRRLDIIWECAAVAGWRPIISTPDEQRSEAWHFDFWDGWDTVRLRMGYDQACLCAALDVGHAGVWQSDARLVQALLLKLGMGIGDVDGIVGSRTKAALIQAGFSPEIPADQTKLISLLTRLRSLSPMAWHEVRG